LVAAAHAATLTGSHARATRLLGGGDIRRRASALAPITAVWAVHDNALAATHSGLGDEALTAAWAEGRAMALEQAVAYALDELPSE
jgi:hypothetical protein